MQERLNQLTINAAIQIPTSEFEFSFARSGGPGGQNVNKVNSKAILRWNPSMSIALPETVRVAFVEKYASRITTDGVLIITSQKFRDQYRNVDDCLAKLCEMIHSVLNPPKPRRPTKPSRAAKARRIESKTHNSAKKAQRRTPSFD